MLKGNKLPQDEKDRLFDAIKESHGIMHSEIVSDSKEYSNYKLAPTGDGWWEYRLITEEGIEIAGYAMQREDNSWIIDKL